MISKSFKEIRLWNDMVKQYLFFAEKLDEFSELCSDKAMEIGTSSKNLAHILLREKTPMDYRVFVDMARLGYRYAIPSSIGVMLDTAGVKTTSKVIAHIRGKKTIPCAVFCKDPQWRYCDYFLKRIDRPPEGGYEIGLYYIGDPQTMEVINVAVEKGGPLCKERANDSHRLCFDANNVYKLNKQDFVSYLMRLVTEKGKHDYFELRDAAFKAAGTKELDIEAAIESMMKR